MKTTQVFLPLALLLAVTLSTGHAFAGNAIYTTDKTGTVVNQNIYALSTDVYLSGGPQNNNASGLADGTYYFQVTDPSGNTLLSTDIALCRQLLVSGGRVAGPTGPSCRHAHGTFDPADGTLPVQLFPFNPTPNAGNEYKAWLIAQTASTSVSASDPTVLIFSQSDAKTDNFKVQNALAPPPPGSCQGSSALTVLVTGRNVIGYVPKGYWEAPSTATGLSVVNVEGSSVTPAKSPDSSRGKLLRFEPVDGSDGVYRKQHGCLFAHRYDTKQYAHERRQRFHRLLRRHLHQLRSCDRRHS